MRDNYLPGHITICRPSRGDDKETINFSLVDEASGVEFAHVEIALNDFARALTGCGHQPIRFRHRGALVGMRREHEYREVFIPEGYGAERLARAQAAVQALEADGWKGRVSDACNHHRRLRSAEGGAIYQVLFERHVSQEPTDG
jgi:hypothetical protein